MIIKIKPLLNIIFNYININFTNNYLHIKNY
jgi:hypothetical protein